MNGSSNPDTNGSNTTSPNKKYDKLNICHLCEYPHLTINYPKLAKEKRFLS